MIAANSKFLEGGVLLAHQKERAFLRSSIIAPETTGCYPGRGLKHQGSRGNMKWKRPLRMLRRILLVLLLLAIAFLGIAFLPGSVEGNYRGIASSCGCDGISFINLQQGRIIHYFSAHPPASIMGRYQKAPDGGVDLWLTNWLEGEPEKHVFKVYPRFLITKFVSPDEGRDYWCWKWPSLGRIGESLHHQEVSLLNARTGSTLTREIYNHDLKWIRHETKIGKGKWTVDASSGDR